MKKLFLLLTLLPMVVTSSNAQETGTTRQAFPTEKGTIVAGADLSYSFGTEFDELRSLSDQYFFGISHRLGVFVADNIAIGMNLDLDLEYYGQHQTHSTSTRVGAIGRYYFGKAMAPNGTAKKVRIFLEAGLGCGHEFQNYQDIAGSAHYSEYNTLNVRGIGGVNYFVNRRAAIEVALGGSYQHHFTEQLLEKNRQIVSFNAGMQFFIGKK